MRPLIAVFLVWVMTAPIPAQQQSPQPPPDATRGTARFGTTTQLVVEDVLVKSKDGKPVEGLKASDFTVTEDGKPQKVAVFEYQRLEEELLPEPSLKPAPAQPAASPQQPPPKPVTAVQIAPERPGDIKYRDRRLLVMFFDLTSMPIPD